MGPEEDPVVHAYSLRQHPFEQRELNPLANPGDRELVCPVDGWQKVSEVEAFLADRARGRDGAVVVVFGGSGTGRTSLANYLTSVWSDNHELAPDSIILVRRKVRSFNAV